MRASPLDATAGPAVTEVPDEVEHVDRRELRIGSLAERDRDLRRRRREVGAAAGVRRLRERVGADRAGQGEQGDQRAAARDTARADPSASHRHQAPRGRRRRSRSAPPPRINAMAPARTATSIAVVAVSCACDADAWAAVTASARPASAPAAGAAGDVPGEASEDRRLLIRSRLVVISVSDGQLGRELDVGCLDRRVEGRVARRRGLVDRLAVDRARQVERVVARASATSGAS